MNKIFSFILGLFTTKKTQCSKACSKPVNNSKTACQEPREQREFKLEMCKPNEGTLSQEVVVQDAPFVDESTLKMDFKEEVKIDSQDLKIETFHVDVKPLGSNCVSNTQCGKPECCKIEEIEDCSIEGSQDKIAIEIDLKKMVEDVKMTIKEPEPIHYPVLKEAKPVKKKVVKKSKLGVKNKVVKKPVKKVVKKPAKKKKK